MNIKKQIGERIREIRKKKHFSQEKLSEMLDIGQNTLSYIEKGENFFSSETLEKMISVLEIEPYELFDFRHQKNNEELLKEINKLLKQNPQKIQEIYKIIKAIIN